MVGLFGAGCWCCLVAVNCLPMSPCRRCGKAHINRNGYCADHQELAVGWRKRQVGKTTTERGYGHAWRKLGDRIYLRDRATCYVCKRLVLRSEADIDHKIPKEFGGTDDESNLGVICRKPCHQNKTREESLRGRQMYLGEGVEKV